LANEVNKVIANMEYNKKEKKKKKTEKEIEE